MVWCIASQLDLEYGIPQRLALESDENLSTRCDESLKLKFEALDDNGLPAHLTAGMLERVEVSLTPVSISACLQSVSIEHFMGLQMSLEGLRLLDILR